MSKSRIFCTVSVFMLAVTPFVAMAQTERPAQSADSAKVLKNDPLHVFSQSVQSLSDHVNPSVVQVLTFGFGLSASSDKTDTAYLTPQRSTGAGVILSPDGYIVTNAHVVEGARRIRVRLQGLDKNADDVHGPIDAHLVGLDRQTDLAVPKIDNSDLPPLELADSSALKQGQLVLAFGSPLGLENSVTMGVVSATSRQIDPDNPAIYIQTDAPINPGNSGGPLVDVDGHVVGINTFILSQSGGNEGLGFAIPSNVVRSTYEQIRAEGHVHRGQIGVFIRAITPDLVQGLHLTSNTGVLLEDIPPDSPADKAGLKIGDIVKSINGKPVNNIREFALDLYMFRIGQTAQVGVLRGSERLTFSVPVVEKPNDPERFADLVNGPNNIVARLGLVALTVDDKLQTLLPDLRIQAGVLVAARTPTSVLLGDGPEAGDVIHAINGNPVQNLQELRENLRSVRPGDPVVLQIERAGSLSYLVLESD